MDNCATCEGSGKAPCGMDMSGPNHRPARVRYGPCPACRDGKVCPRCFYEGGMDDDDQGLPKCRYRGWRAADDRARARRKPAGTVDPGGRDRTNC